MLDGRIYVDIQDMLSWAEHIRQHYKGNQVADDIMNSMLKTVHSKKNAKNINAICKCCKFYKITDDYEGTCTFFNHNVRQFDYCIYWGE